MRGMLLRGRYDLTLRRGMAMGFPEGRSRFERRSDILQISRDALAGSTGSAEVSSRSRTRFWF